MAEAGIETPNVSWLEPTLNIVVLYSKCILTFLLKSLSNFQLRLDIIGRFTDLMITENKNKRANKKGGTSLTKFNHTIF